MSITVHPGFLSDSVCTGFANGLSGTSGWFLAGNHISQDLNSNEPVFLSAHDRIPIAPDNRIMASNKVIVAFKKFDHTFEPVGWNIYLFIEGNWSGFASGRRYTFCAGDMVISQLKLEIKTTSRPGRGGRWVTAVQNIRDLGISKILIAQALVGTTGVLSSSSEIRIVPVPNPSGDDSDDESEMPRLEGLTVEEHDGSESESESIPFDENDENDENDDEDEELIEDDQDMTLVSSNQSQSE